MFFEDLTNHCITILYSKTLITFITYNSSCFRRCSRNKKIWFKKSRHHVITGRSPARSYDITSPSQRDSRYIMTLTQSEVSWRFFRDFSTFREIPCSIPSTSAYRSLFPCWIAIVCEKSPFFPFPCWIAIVWWKITICCGGEIPEPVETPSQKNRAQPIPLKPEKINHLPRPSLLCCNSWHD